MTDNSELIEQACQTPLTELARSVPKDLRAEWESQWWPDGTACGHSMAPVGKYLHDMADVIEKQAQALRDADKDLFLVREMYDVTAKEYEYLKAKNESLQARVVELEARLKLGNRRGKSEIAYIQEIAFKQRIAELEEQLDNERAKSIHSCGPNCQRPLCVANRRIAELELALRYIESFAHPDFPADDLAGELDRAEKIYLQFQNVASFALKGDV